ncbi:MAG: enolase C-terminal domain-like protein [Bryobacterales bacterium]|nr:enolase C-terminal domain-like protein [Bryobacterales bacterium]
MRRRTLLTGFAVGPATTMLGRTQTRAGARLKIAAVEILQLEGEREALVGPNRQYQVNPLHIYDEHRPAPYRDPAQGERKTAPVSAYYLRIGTDAGLEGLYGPVDREAAIVVDQQLRGFLMGKDALAGETVWDQMYRSNRHSRHGHFMMAISAVDNALWDLRGRYFGVPVYRLLGGPTRSAVEAYASCLGFSLEPEKAGERAREFKKLGFRYQKWFLAYGPGSGPEGMARNVELVRTLREAVGEETELMFDAYMGWDLNYAVTWAKQVERWRPHWIEECFPPDKMEAFRELRRKTTIPVAAGEHIYGRWEAHRYLAAEALDVLQCDPEWCGGVSELVRICAVASIYDVRVVPHGHALHAALHVVASQSPATCPLVEYLVLKMQYWHHFERNPPRLEGSRIPLPQAPGFGIELDPAKIRKRTVARWS